MTIEELKKENGGCRTEDIFGIHDPVEFQCPKFDDLYSDIKSMEKSVSNALRAIKNGDTDDTEYNVDDLEWTINRLDDKVRDIHANLEELREWGNEWKTLAKEALEGKIKLDDYKPI